MSEPPSDDAAARFFGYALMVIGGMVLALSGLCTGFGLLIGFSGLLNGGNADFEGMNVFAMTAMLGAPPIVGSLLLFLFGRWLVRRNTPPAPESGSMLDLGGDQDPPT